MELKVRISTAIASHLSDAQELMYMGFHREAAEQINVAKAILFKYPNTEVEVSNGELDEVAKKALRR